jgi:hypothetical protein
VVAAAAAARRRSAENRPDHSGRGNSCLDSERILRREAGAVGERTQAVVHPSWAAAVPWASRPSVQAEAGAEAWAVRPACARWAVHPVHHVPAAEVEAAAGDSGAWAARCRPFVRAAEGAGHRASAAFPAGAPFPAASVADHQDSQAVQASVPAPSAVAVPDTAADHPLATDRHRMRGAAAADPEAEEAVAGEYPTGLGPGTACVRRDQQDRDHQDSGCSFAAGRTASSTR